MFIVETWLMYMGEGGKIKFPFLFVCLFGKGREATVVARGYFVGSWIPVLTCAMGLSAGTII